MNQARQDERWGGLRIHAQAIQPDGRYYFRAHAECAVIGVIRLLPQNLGQLPHLF